LPVPVLRWNFMRVVVGCRGAFASAPILVKHGREHCALR
jgi:hypothetical protein